MNDFSSRYVNALQAGLHQGMALDTQRHQNALAPLRQQLLQSQVDNSRAAGARSAKEFEMRVAQHAASLDAAQAAQQAEVIRQGIFAASAAATPEQWDATALQFDQPDLVGQFAQKDALLAQYMTAAQILERQAGSEPPAGFRNLELRAEAAGLQKGSPAYAEFMRTGGSTGQFFEFETADGTRFASGFGGAGSSKTSPARAAKDQMTNDIPAGGQEAFGLQGAAKGALNTVSDFFGFGEVFENAAEQTRFFQNLEEGLLVNLSQAYGRQPAQALMERLRNLVPNAATLEGPDRAFGELQQMQRRFQRELAVLDQQLNQRMSQSDRADVRARRFGLQSALMTIDEAMTRLSPPTPQADQRQIDLMNRLLEGQ